MPFFLMTFGLAIVVFNKGLAANVLANQPIVRMREATNAKIWFVRILAIVAGLCFFAGGLLDILGVIHVKHG